MLSLLLTTRSSLGHDLMQRIQIFLHFVLLVQFIRVCLVYAPPKNKMR
jgi:hypothetical protein